MQWTDTRGSLSPFFWIWFCCTPAAILVWGSVRPHALLGWFWPGMLQSPCSVHPACIHTPALCSTVGSLGATYHLEPDDTHAPSCCDTHCWVVLWVNWGISIYLYTFSPICIYSTIKKHANRKTNKENIYIYISYIYVYKARYVHIWSAYIYI